MGKRIEGIHKNNPAPHINIDMPSLMAEHEERMEGLGKVLEISPVFKKWDDVISANRKLMDIEKPVH